MHHKQNPFPRRIPHNSLQISTTHHPPPILPTQTLRMILLRLPVICKATFSTLEGVRNMAPGQCPCAKSL